MLDGEGAKWITLVEQAMIQWIDRKEQIAIGDPKTAIWLRGGIRVN